MYRKSNYLLRSGLVLASACILAFSIGCGKGDGDSGKETKPVVTPPVSTEEAKILVDKAYESAKAYASNTSKIEDVVAAYNAVPEDNRKDLAARGSKETSFAAYLAQGKANTESRNLLEAWLKGDGKDQIDAAFVVLRAKDATADDAAEVKKVIDALLKIEPKEVNTGFDAAKFMTEYKTTDASETAALIDALNKENYDKLFAAAFTDTTTDEAKAILKAINTHSTVEDKKKDVRNKLLADAVADKAKTLAFLGALADFGLDGSLKTDEYTVGANTGNLLFVLAKQVPTTLQMNDFPEFAQPVKALLKADYTDFASAAANPNTAHAVLAAIAGSSAAKANAKLLLLAGATLVTDLEAMIANLGVNPDPAQDDLKDLVVDAVKDPAVARELAAALFVPKLAQLPAKPETTAMLKALLTALTALSPAEAAAAVNMKDASNANRSALMQLMSVARPVVAPNVKADFDKMIVLLVSTPKSFAQIADIPGQAELRYVRDQVVADPSNAVVTAGLTNIFAGHVPARTDGLARFILANAGISASAFKALRALGAQVETQRLALRNRVVARAFESGANATLAVDAVRTTLIDVDFFDKQDLSDMNWQLAWTPGGIDMNPGFESSLLYAVLFAARSQAAGAKIVANAIGAVTPPNMLQRAGSDTPNNQYLTEAMIKPLALAIKGKVPADLDWNNFVAVKKQDAGVNESTILHLVQNFQDTPAGWQVPAAFGIGYDGWTLEKLAKDRLGFTF